MFGEGVTLMIEMALEGDYMYARLRLILWGWN